MTGPGHPQGGATQTLPAALAELDAALRERDAAIEQADRLEQLVGELRREVTSLCRIKKLNTAIQPEPEPTIKPSPVLCPVCNCTEETATHWRHTQPPPEPPLTDTELVAVRQLLEERFGPQL